MDSVKVALRIRPLVTSEMELGCRPCIQRTPNEPQIAIGKANQMFTYNYVFDELEGQRKVYDVAVKSLIDNLFKGYNVTILAYGQTGSGKTYTMGTNYSGEGELGVIPRAVYDIFDQIRQIDDQTFKVTTTFIELYNESLYDLLSGKPRNQSIVEMREYDNSICIPGLSELEVTSPEETLARLKEGSSERVVGSTAMNAQSSRSHAIFTINLKIVPKSNPTETMTSKFHLVDLAGSERSKKTGASGERFREGVNINKGLLVLGNVISQLGEGTHTFINYRDSKLTRLLQDSLGGNSVTLMIACVSPADYNQEETISTLRYADRARKIKNKPVVNQDPRLAELIKLRKENEDLKLKLIGEGKAFDQCPPEHKVLQIQLGDANKKINQLSKALHTALIQITNLQERAVSIEAAETTLKEKLSELMSLSETIPKDDPRWLQLREKLSEVQSEHKKMEDELQGFDKNDNAYEEEKDEQEDADEGEGQDDLAQRRQEHILSHEKIQKELSALTKNLVWKEDLMKKLTESTDHLDQMRGVSQESVDQLKKQIAELEQEKEELIRQIRTNTSSQNSAKIAETRRKKLQELETKVTALLKKVSEQERIIKMKEKSDEKIMTLRQEIMSMKQMKVRLIQQMKAENDKFKAFRAQKDKEVCQLRNQNIKKQNQMKKMEQIHALQQGVLRRKLESAAAANKRLMAVLERQKAARDRKAKGLSSEKIKERIAEELELLESEYQAQKSLENLLQDRASLNKEKAVIQESLGHKSLSKEERKKLQLDLHQIDQELELRSAEISDLQQKLFDINQDDHSRHYWDSLQSMADAKFALTYLKNLLTEKVRENLTVLSEMSELKENQAEAEEQISKHQQQLENLEIHFRRRIEDMEKDCEEKVYLLAKVAVENLEKANVLSPAQLEDFTLKLQDLEKLDHLRKQVEELKQENSKLTKQNADPFKKFLDEKMNKTFVLQDKNSTFTIESAEDDYSPETPIHKRVNALKQNGKLGKRMSIGQCACADCEMKIDMDCSSAKMSSNCKENCSCERLSCPDRPKKPRSSRLYTFEQDGFPRPSTRKIEE